MGCERRQGQVGWVGGRQGESKGSHTGGLKSWRQEGNHLCLPRDSPADYSDNVLWKQKREEAGRVRSRGTSYKAVQMAGRPVEE